MPSALQDVPSGRMFQSKEPHSTITPSDLSERWYIGLGQVTQTLKVTTQWLMCSAILPLVRRYRVDRMFTYLTANCREKIWTYAGPEFGSERGQPMIIKKALYGLKSSGAAFRAHLAETLHDIGFNPTKADPDVWIHLVVKPDGSEYYEYVMCYVDDILSVSLDRKSILQSLQGQFILKGDKIEPPDMYLGTQLGTMQVEGNDGWFMSSEKYIKSAIQNIEDMLQKTGQ